MIYFEFRIAVFTEMCLFSFKYFCNSRKKFLRTTYCLLHGILSFQCVLVMNNFFNKRTWDLLRNNIAKTLFHKTKAFIVINVRFENWQIPVETYPRIFSNFLKFIYYFIFIDFIRSTDAFRPIVRAQKYLMIYNRRYFKATARIGCMIPRSI